jgi:hypothetical protein
MFEILVSVKPDREFGLGTCLLWHGKRMGGVRCDDPFMVYLANR